MFADAEEPVDVHSDFAERAGRRTADTSRGGTQDVIQSASHGGVCGRLHGLIDVWFFDYLLQLWMVWTRQYAVCLITSPLSNHGIS